MRRAALLSATLLLAAPWAGGCAGGGSIADVADFSEAASCDGVTCSGHGTCVLSDGGPSCVCGAGYAGDACDECADGYHAAGGGECVPDPTCATDDPCGEHGTCDDSSGTINCLCDTGYAGTYCDSCYPGYHDDGTGDCILDQTCLPNSCAGHGACDDSSGVVVCTCDEGYAGSFCESCAGGFHDDGTGTCVRDEACAVDTCSRHGACDNTSGVAVCTCDEGYAGEHCESCRAGYHDDGTGACVVDESCLAGTCAGHGLCTDAGGVVICLCDEGYAGENCEGCAGGYHRDAFENCVPDEDCDAGDPCGEHGTCVDTTGEIACECDAGFAGEFCDACAPGYHDDGAGGCVVDETCQPATCSAHGACDDSTGVVSCACDPGYAGTFCQTCAVDFHRLPDETCGADEHCAAGDPCGAHGTCDDTSGTIECFCAIGYAGEFCDSCYPGYHDDGTGACVLDEHCMPSTCSGHGACRDTGGVVSCSCDAAYSGVYCQGCAPDHHREPDDSCSPDESCVGRTCSGHGVCAVTAGHAACVCDAGYAGTDCESCAADYETNMVTRRCEIPCAEGDNYIRCGSRCVFGTSPANCGACGAACAGGRQCRFDLVASYCLCPDGPRWDDCGADACVDLYFDPAHCGGCATSCAAGETCFMGHCQTPGSSCDPECGGDTPFCCPDGFCAGHESALWDDAHCGDCATDCGGDGWICVAGSCYSGDLPPDSCSPPCDPGAVCCSDGGGGSGTCVDRNAFRVGPDNCGGCNVHCGDGEQCVDGACICGSAFDPAFDLRRCGSACVDLHGDEANCGTCGNACAAGQVCVGGLCQSATSTACAPAPCGPDQLCCADAGGGGTCLGAPNWGEGLGFDEANCGGCGVACPAGEECWFGVCLDMPGETCDDPLAYATGDPDGGGGAYWDLCAAVDDGNYPTACPGVPDGASVESFFRVPLDAPGEWEITFGPISPGLDWEGARMSVYRAGPTDYCTIVPGNEIGCLSFGETLTFDAAAPGEIVVMIYSALPGACGPIAYLVARGAGG
jgi:hypothetical protein